MIYIFTHTYIYIALENGVLFRNRALASIIDLYKAFVRIHLGASDVCLDLDLIIYKLTPESISLSRLLSPSNLHRHLFCFIPSDISYG